MKTLKKLEELKQLFLAEAKENKDFPIGGGIWLRLHPEDLNKPPYTSWEFNQATRRMPEFTAPGLGTVSNKVVAEIEIDENANGVIYALGGAGGGLSLYMENGYLIYEYNLFIIEQYEARSREKLPKGKHTIEITTELKMTSPDQRRISPLASMGIWWQKPL